MIYPSVGQYTEAIKLAEQSPEDYFATMTTLRPVLGADGNPVMSSGNFAVVFKMQDQTDGKIYALKCFTRDQEGRNESYRLIADELQYIESEYLAKIQYLENELFVDTGTDDTEFPVLLMDWVEGETLDKYIKNHINEQACLNLLAGRFCIFADWLLKQPFAHGDLKPDNIIVKDDGTLVIVDYDGMFVPKMRGQKARELGSPDFRHPQRTEDDFDEHIDDFAVVTILLSLKALSLNNKLLDALNAKDCVLLHTQDFSNLAQSTVNQKLQELIGDRDFARVYAVFVVVLAEKVVDDVGKMMLSNLVSNIDTNMFVQTSDDNLSMYAESEDFTYAIKDDFGVLYSNDGKRLLECRKQVDIYSVHYGTKVLCNYAFDYSRSSSCVSKPCLTLYGSSSIIKEIVLPNTLLYIGHHCFNECVSLQKITIPDNVISIGANAFTGCKSLQTINISKKVTKIEHNTFSGCIALQNITLPNGIKVIEERAFTICKSLEEINIPAGMIKIGESVFSGCESLQKIDIPNSVEHLGEGVFSGCISLRIVNLPNCISEIGYGLFSNCPSLESVVIPNRVTKIGDFAFSNCKSLTTINIPNNVTSIGCCAFTKCESLHNLTLSDNIVNLGDHIFSGCISLNDFSIPNGVSIIEFGMFENCMSLKTISIPNGVTEIGDRAFLNCKSLEYIDIPDTVKCIGYEAFKGCSSLRSIIIPDSVKKINPWAFEQCEKLQQIVVSEKSVDRLTRFLDSKTIKLMVVRK